MSQRNLPHHLNYQNFEEQSLSKYNFSNCDIRGKKFTNQILIKADFSYAKSGIKTHWIIFLFLKYLLLSALAGIFSTTSSLYTSILLKSENYNTLYGVVVLLSILLFIITTLRKGLLAGLVRGIVFLAPSLVISAAVIETKEKFGSIFFAGVGAIFLITISLAAIALAIVGITVLINSVSIAIVVTSGIAIFISAVIVKTSESVPTTIILSLLGNYIAYKALNENQNFYWILYNTVAFTSLFGTSFRGADLTDANFTQATLKNTDFRGANLTRTCWHKSKKLELARVDDSILSKPSLRDLLVSKKGYKKSFVGENLKGANLAGANLEQADFKETDISEATFQGASLKWANLTKSQAVGTNFTHAYLTGACLEAWNIDSTTILKQIDCQYIFLQEHPHPITGDRERRPHNPDQVFEPGDFEKLYTKIINTVQIMLRNGINSEAFHLAFQKIMEKNPEITPDSIQAIEKKGHDVLVTIEVSEGTDKGKIQRSFDEIYEARLAALSGEYYAKLKELSYKHENEIKALTLKYESELKYKEQQLASMSDVIFHLAIANEKKYDDITQNYESELEALEVKYQTDLQNVIKNYETELKALEIKYHIELKGKDEHLSTLKEILIQSVNQPIKVNVEVNTKAESKAMNQSNDQSRKIENKDGNVIGNILGDNSSISGTIAHTINQLPAAAEPDKPGIKELLTQLQSLVEADTNLTPKNKEKALKQVKALAEAAQNPKKEEQQNLADDAITMLKGIITGLPSAATLIEACTKIAALLGLA